MYAAFYLLTIVGMVGAYDVLYYHIYKLRLYQHHDAIWENVTHLVRALLFAIMLLTVLHVRASGWWWFLYPTLLGFELINTMTDVVLEPRTRKNIGGLPPVEYILHIFLSLMTGAALASIIWATHDKINAPTSLHLETLQVGSMVLAGAYSSIVMAMGMFSFELYSFIKLLGQRGAKPASPAVAVKPSLPLDLSPAPLPSAVKPS